MPRVLRYLAVALVGVLTVASVAMAAVSFDPATGTGFVGKGDVQLVYGWNNAALQANHLSVGFRASSTVVTEVSWTCQKTAPNGNEIIQERARTTTTSIAGLLSSTARVKNQITGFNLNGYRGSPTESSTTDGPAVNTCPANPSGFVLLEAAGDPVVVSDTTVLQVSTDNATWYNL